MPNAVLIATLATICLAATAPAADWPQFLGPGRTGVASAAEPPLPDDITLAAEPLWKKPVGAGFAGPVVAGGKVIICHRESSDLVTSALDAPTGKELWRSSYTTDYIDSFGFDNGPRAVPAIADGTVFTYGPEGRVTAISLDAGKERWAFDAAAAVQSPPGYFGRAPSPLAVGGRVIIAAGGPNAGLVALDAVSGKKAWQTVADEAGYSSPVLLSQNTPAGAIILAWMRNNLWLVDGAAGRVLASMPLRSSMDASVNAATPVSCGGERWFVSAGYGVGANLLTVDPARDPVFKTVWTKQEVMDCHYSSPVYHDGYLYGFHGRQETGQTLRCVDAEKGTVQWQSPKVPGGTLLRVADKLLVVTERGELWIVRAAPGKFELLTESQILRAGHRSHAAFSDGILFARDDENLVAVRLR